MKYIINFTILFPLLLFSFSIDSNAFIFPLGKATIKVVDNDGLPVKDAKVTVRFDYSKGPGMGWGTSSKFVDGKTDNNGTYTLTKISSRRWYYTVKKEGFYLSGETCEFREKTALMVWSPWNPVLEIALKKIKNPTSMYAKNTTAMKVPAFDKPLGYDLEKGDWVKPYGKGLTSDFVFLFHIEFKDDENWKASYKLTFYGEHDGIQEYTPRNGNQSAYYWPYDAPEDGYKQEVMWKAENYKEGWGFKHKSDYKEDRKYIFRVRTKVDEDGEIIEAKYGKISGDIRLYGNGFFKFSYFFNPSGTRSLEYDAKHPLFKWSRKEWEHEVKGP